MGSRYIFDVHINKQNGKDNQLQTSVLTNANCMSLVLVDYCNCFPTVLKIITDKLQWVLNATISGTQKLCFGTQTYIR